jgi:hypothetical protein
VSRLLKDNASFRIARSKASVDVLRPGSVMRTYNDSRAPQKIQELALILDQLARKYSATHDPDRRRHLAMEMSKLSEVMTSLRLGRRPS